MVSLTLMLVIVTIVSVIQMNLPVTPYLKLIDVWLFIATNMMVYLLMFHTFVEYSIKKEANNNISLKDIFFSRKSSRWGDVSGSATRSYTVQNPPTQPHFKLLLCLPLLI